jgi:hypothetical protein
MLMQHNSYSLTGVKCECFVVGATKKVLEETRVVLHCVLIELHKVSLSITTLKWFCLELHCADIFQGRVNINTHFQCFFKPSCVILLDNNY